MAACAGHEKTRRNSAGWMLLHVTEGGKNENGQQQDEKNCVHVGTFTILMHWLFNFFLIAVLFMA